MLSIDATMPERGLDISLRVERGETVAILGPNGAGKSTVLGILAGLVRPESGHAHLAGRTLFDLGAPGPARPAPCWVPPHARGVALLPQEALLFPHLTAASNVAFGPRSAGAGRRESHAQALHWLREVDAVELAGRRPTELSGGQAQRVAVARALAAQPQLLLLDEPLSALDVAAAPLVRRMLRRVLANQTVLLVTHDVLDALTLADRVVVMHDGRIIEEGPTRDVLERPRTRFTADLAALNLVTGTRTHVGVMTDAGASVILPLATDTPLGTRVGVAVRPANVEVSLLEPRGLNLTVFPALVRDLEPRGDVVRVRTDALFADLTPRAIADLDLEPGTRAYFSFDSVDAVTYPL
ncbi:ABC transporter ATP-binding protein [Cryobacterium roopkundense]|nr:molybdate transport system ATP-binding protein [Cryobacterium roopkundense]